MGGKLAWRTIKDLRGLGDEGKSTSYRKFPIRQCQVCDLQGRAQEARRERWAITTVVKKWPQRGGRWGHSSLGDLVPGRPGRFLNSQFRRPFPALSGV
jgi:hypothetical protein